MAFTTSDQIGSFAELIARTDLSRPVVGRYRRPLFRVTALGDKLPTIDLLVEVLDANDAARGFFFAQVKGTMRTRDRGARLPLSVDPEKYNRLARLPVPAFLIGVDVVAEQSYLVAAHRSRAASVSSITRAFPLRDPAVRIALYRELLVYWRANKPILRRTRFKDV